MAFINSRDATVKGNKTAYLVNVLKHQRRAPHVKLVSKGGQQHYSYFEDASFDPNDKKASYLL